MSKVGISVTAKTNGVKQSLGKISGSLKNINKDMGSWYNSTRKLNQQFVNLNKDANRTANGISKLSGSLKKLAGSASVIALGNAMAKMVNSAIESIETTNLFNVALGEMSDTAMETVNQLHELYGLDTTNLKNSVATYALLAKSMGMSSEQAEILGTNVTRMAIDLSSLMNVPIQQVMSDLRSGLVGQSETVYKYGMDVTEAGLKEEAFALGISKSVRNMSQGEKMALRYSKMIRTTSQDLGGGVSVVGDFGRTINTPANQLKILAERFTSLGRSIGTIFLPVLQQILPYMNALVQVLIIVADAVAKFFGYTEDLSGGAIGKGVKSLEENADDASDAIDGATESLKKMKNATLGMDELHVLPDQSKSDLGTGVSILPDFEMPTLAELDNLIKTKTDGIVATILEQLGKLKDALAPTTDALRKLWDEGLSKFGNFVGDNLVSFYNNFLKPVGSWVFGEGLPKLLTTLNDLMNNINWDKLNDKFSGLYSSLAPFSTKIGAGLITFYEKFCIPIATWVMNEGLPDLIELVQFFLDNIDLTPMIDAFINLGEALAPFVTAVADGLITFIKQLAKFLTPALNTVLDVFSTLLNIIADVIDAIPVDVAKAIGGAIGGIATAFLIFATATTVASIIMEIKKSIKALLDALTAHPLLLVAMGVSALVGALVTLAKEKFDQTELGKYAQKIDELAKSSKALNDEVDRLLEKHEQRRLDIEDEFGGIKILADKYMELVKQETLTNEQKTLMKTYSEELIKKIPELKDLIDEETGAYKGTEDQIYSLIQTTKDYYLLQAAQEQLTEISREQFKVQQEMSEQEKIRKELLDKLADKTAIYRKGIEAFNGTSEEYSEWCKQNETDLWSLKGELDGYQKLIGAVDDQLNINIDTQEDLNDQWNYASDYISNFATTAEEEIPKASDVVDTELSKIETKVSNFKLPKLMIDVGFNTPDSLGNLKGIYEPVVPDAFKDGGVVKKYAMGGTPDFGDLFIANDGAPELVGHIGHQTAVVNQDQIVEAVSSGVARAVASVMGSGSGGTTVIENVLQLDGEVIYTNQQRVAKNRGIDFGMGVFAR